MKKHLVNYSNNTHHNSQILNTNSALSEGGFDYVFSFKYSDLEENFINENIKIL